MAHVMMMSKPTKMSCVVQQVEGYQNNPPTPLVTQTDIDLLDISSLTFLLSMHIQKHRLFLFIYLFVYFYLFIYLFTFEQILAAYTSFSATIIRIPFPGDPFHQPPD